MSAFQNNKGRNSVVQSHKTTTKSVFEIKRMSQPIVKSRNNIDTGGSTIQTTQNTSNNIYTRSRTPCSRPAQKTNQYQTQNDCMLIQTDSHTIPTPTEGFNLHDLAYPNQKDCQPQNQPKILYDNDHRRRIGFKSELVQVHQGQGRRVVDVATKVLKKVPVRHVEDCPSYRDMSPIDQLNRQVKEGIEDLWNAQPKRNLMHEDQPLRTFIGNHSELKDLYIHNQALNAKSKQSNNTLISFLNNSSITSAGKKVKIQEQALRNKVFEVKRPMTPNLVQRLLARSDKVVEREKVNAATLPTDQSTKMLESFSKYEQVWQKQEKSRPGSVLTYCNAYNKKQELAEAIEDQFGTVNNPDHTFQSTISRTNEKLNHFVKKEQQPLVSRVVLKPQTRQVVRRPQSSMCFGSKPIKSIAYSKLLRNQERKISQDKLQFGIDGLTDFRSMLKKKENNTIEIVGESKLKQEKQFLQSKNVDYLSLGYQKNGQQVNDVMRTFTDVSNGVVKFDKMKPVMFIQTQ